MVQSSPTLLSATGLVREYLLQEEEGQRHDVETEDKSRVQLLLLFSPPEIKYNHSLSFPNNMYFQALILPIYFISINVPCSVDLKTEMSGHSF